MSFPSLDQYLEEEERGLPCCAPQPSLFRKLYNQDNDDTETTCSDTASELSTDDSERPLIQFEPHASLTDEENAFLVKFSAQLNRLSENDVLSIVEEFTQCTEIRNAQEEERTAEEEADSEETLQSSNVQEKEVHEPPSKPSRRVSHWEQFMEARFGTFSRNLGFLSREAAKLQKK